MCVSRREAARPCCLPFSPAQRPVTSALGKGIKIMTRKITWQKTWTFPDTGDSITLYIADNPDGFAMALATSHLETAESLEEKGSWSTHYPDMWQVQSPSTKGVWYIYLSSYWSTLDAETCIPSETVLQVRTGGRV